MKGSVIRWAAAAVVVTAVAVSSVHQTAAVEALRVQVDSQQRQIEAFQNGVPSPRLDWPSIAAVAERSVFTIDAGDDLGTGWVAASDGRGSDLVTNFHVVAAAWSAGNAAVEVRRNDAAVAGTISRVDVADDLAIIHVAERLPALHAVDSRPDVGAAVMAIGSPLGLDGTVTVGVVSGFHSVEGSDYIQFSAPISPGNSGGPVLDDRGRVVAIASDKFVGTGVEGIALGIPVQVACSSLVSCTPAGMAGGAATGTRYR